MNNQEIRDIFDSDTRIAYIREYTDGFVAHRYKWPAPGIYNIYYRNGNSATGKYDRKRSYGRGPRWVAFSANQGRLASG